MNSGKQKNITPVITWKRLVVVKGAPTQQQSPQPKKNMGRAMSNKSMARNDTKIELHLIDAHNLLGGIASDLESVGFDYMARRVADVNLRVYKILHCDIPEMLAAEKEKGE